MKLVSWNVNGLRACVGKGFFESVASLDADVIALQETKMQAGQFEGRLEGYHAYFNYAEKKGYSGTALFSRVEPISVEFGRRGARPRGTAHRGGIRGLHPRRMLHAQFAEGAGEAGLPHALGGRLPRLAGQAE